jgi:hypothetical protein
MGCNPLAIQRRIMRRFLPMDPFISLATKPAMTELKSLFYSKLNRKLILASLSIFYDSLAPKLILRTLFGFTKSERIKGELIFFY